MYVSIITEHSCEKAHTSGGSNLDMKGSNAELTATSCNVLSCQHGGVWRGLVTISLDLHSSCHTADGFATTTTKLSARCLQWKALLSSATALKRARDEPEIGNMNESIILGWCQLLLSSAPDDFNLRMMRKCGQRQIRARLP